MMGAVGTIVLLGVIERVTVAIKLGRVLKVTRQDLVLLKDLAKLAVASGLAAFSAALVRSAMLGMKPFAILATCGTAFGVTYLAAILLLKIVTVEEMDFLRDSVTKLQRRVYLKRAADTLS